MQAATARAPRDREIGFALCQLADGQVIPGVVVTGDLMGVSIPLRCPPGAVPMGTFHTHPQGRLMPSPDDIRAAMQTNIKRLCIGQPETGLVRCWDVDNMMV